MNNIIINKKLKKYQDNSIIITNNTIKFISNGDYTITIEESTNIDIIIEDNITIKLFIISTNNKINNKITYKLGEHSNLILFKFYNNKEVYENELIYLNGIYSNINYNFSSICEFNEEYNIKIYHNNNYARSKISNKCIGNNNSKIVFNIDSVLEKGNKYCKMDQDTKIICMGDVDTKINPNMYIEEDDVEARHGSVVGRFNDENLFYLMSRGITENESIKLMIKGFILGNLILDMEKRKQILDIINKTYK